MLLLIDGPGPWWTAPMIFVSAWAVMLWSISEQLPSAWWRIGPLVAVLASGWWMRSRHAQYQYYKGLAKYEDWSRCPRCEYDLGDLPERRCPECGVTPQEEVERAAKVIRGGS